MVIWINGPFGSGKTTLARELSKQLKPSLIYDPELIGFILQKILPNKSQDFQDIRLWRNLSGALGALLGQYYKGTVIIPMTVVNPHYLQEILGHLAKRGPIRHYFMDIGEDTLRERIQSSAKSN